MRNAKKTICALMLAAFLLVAMSTSVFAAEGGNAWLRVTQTQEGTTAVTLMADVAVSDGYIVLNYDATKLTYVDGQWNSEFMDVYSVNADVPGVVKIAWVSNAQYTVENAVAVFVVNFTGNDDAFTMSGLLNDADGNGLVLLSAVDPAGLEAAITAAKALNPQDYTEETWAAVETALAQAEAVLANAAASQAEFDAATQALNAAVSGLELYVVDYSELTKAVLIARSLVAENYTEESFAAMQAALAQADAVMNNAAARQEDADAAAEALLAAIDGLVLNSLDNTDRNVTELKKAILKAEALDKAAYTKESFAAVEAALATAKAVLENENASQEQIDAATLALNDAIRALDLGTGVPDTGFELAMPIVLVMVLSVLGVVAAIFLLKGKKGRCA